MIIGRYRITQRGYVVFGSFGVILLLILVFLIRSLDISGTSKTDATGETTQQQVENQANGSKTNTEASGASETQSLNLEEKNKILAKEKAVIYFKPNMYELDSAYYPKLDEIINVSKRFKEARIFIDGHYNGYPDFEVTEFFTSLAQSRAEMVEAYFISQGVAPERITLVNKGCSESVNQNDSWQEIEKNRRVEVHFELLK